MNAIIKLHLFLLALVACLAACGGAEPNSSPQDEPGAGAAVATTEQAVLRAHPGRTWYLIWNDEFVGSPLGRIDDNKWKYDIGHNYYGQPGEVGSGWLNHELQHYRDNNVYIDSTGTQLQIDPYKVYPGEWTSGRIESRQKFGPPSSNGALAIEARIWLPHGPPSQMIGYWPAFWTLGNTQRTATDYYHNWPRCGEVDIYDGWVFKNGVYPWVNGARVHCGLAPCAAADYCGGPCNEPSGVGPGNGAEYWCQGLPARTCANTYHVWRVEWDRTVSPERFYWYVDGNALDTDNTNWLDKNNSQFLGGQGPTAWTNGFSDGLFILLNVAIQDTNESTVGPYPMTVDYVRVYQLSTSSTIPGSLNDPGFNSGDTTWRSGWTATGNVSYTMDRSEGLYAISLGGTNYATDTVTQSLVQTWSTWNDTVPNMAAPKYVSQAIPFTLARDNYATLTFSLKITTQEYPTTTPYDVFTVVALNKDGAVVTTLASYSNVGGNRGWTDVTKVITGYADEIRSIRFQSTSDSSLPTTFLIDNVRLMRTR